MGFERGRRALRAGLAGFAFALFAALIGQAPAVAASCPPVPTAPDAATIDAARKAARDHGVLWRISRGGHHSYLYGTLHVGRFEWIFPGPRLSAALRDSRSLALEIDPADPEVQAELAQSGRADGGRFEPSAQQRARLDRQIDLACIPGSALAGMHPLLQAVVLGTLAGRSRGLNPAYSQEAALSALAHAAGRKVSSLESVGLQLEALIPSDPAQVSNALDSALEQLESGDAPAIIARLADDWDRGRLDDLADFEAWCGCVRRDQDRAQLASLNDGRNPYLAERIAALHDAGGGVLAAVGALHMTGPQALPKLLAARGFAVERIAFDD